MANDWSLGTQVIEAGGYHHVQNLPRLHNEASLGYRVKYYLRQTNKETRKQNKVVMLAFLEGSV